MGLIVIKDPYVSINGVDLSEFVRAVNINYGAEALDKTAGAAQAKGKIAGLTDWSMGLELNQDHDAGNVDATLFPLVGAAAFPVIVKMNGSATGATNPKYTGNAILTAYPIGGSVGQLEQTSPTLEGDGVLARAIAD